MRLAALLASAAIVLSLTAVAFGSAGTHGRTPAPSVSPAAPGPGTPFASGTGTCHPNIGYATFVAAIDADHPDPIAELTTDGPATLQAYPNNVDTGGSGSVWGSLGEPLSPGDHATVQISCAGSPSDVNYSLALYDAPSTPVTLSGAATACASCSSQNDIGFVPPGAAHYVASLTLTQGSVDLSNGESDQMFTSSGTFDLGYLVHGQQSLYVTPLAGPTADWTLTIQQQSVTLSGLKFDVAYIRPTQAATISYFVNGDVTLSASVDNSAGTPVRTLTTNLAVKGGSNTLTWDGLDSTGTPVPDGKYTAVVRYKDAAGNPGSASATVEVDGTPPVVTSVSSHTDRSTGQLVLDVHDALSGLAAATLRIGAGGVVQSLTSSGSQFSYAPPGGWSPGSHTWHVTATDNVGNSATSSGTFTVGRSAVPICRVPKLKGKKPKQARRIIKKHLCSVGHVSHGHSRNRLKGRVIGQHPRAGKRVREHTRVRFKVGLGRRSKRTRG